MATSRTRSVAPGRTAGDHRPAPARVLTEAEQRAVRGRSVAAGRRTTQAPRSLARLRFVGNATVRRYGGYRSRRFDGDEGRDPGRPEGRRIAATAHPAATRSRSPTTGRARPTRSRSTTGPSRRWTCGRSRSRDDDFGLMTLRPGVHEHRVLPLGDHLHRRRGRASSSTAAIPIEQLCEHSHLSRGRLPPDLRRAARPPPQLERWTLRRHPPHLRSTRTSRSSSRGSATTPTRWACCSPASARSRPSIRTRSTSTTRRSATWRRSG